MSKRCHCGLSLRKHPRCRVCGQLTGEGHTSQTVAHQGYRLCEGCQTRWIQLEQQAKRTLTLVEIKTGVLQPPLKRDNTQLTEREIEILRDIFQGKSNKQIGFKYKVSDKTIKNQIHSIFLKLDANSRTEAVYKALQRKILNPEEEL